uniref:SKP1 component POZ domain-containing protein n=1 Tax=Chenopodium quinoa TaxID=63459 RepID=A0A803MWW3_CHEQI
MASSSSAAAAASSASSSSKKITLESCDKIFLEISENVSVQSLKIKKILEDLGDNHGDKIPVPNATGSTLGKIVEYCNKYHADLALDGIPPREVNSRTLKP